MSHEQASELLGSYLLDAVDGDELADLEEHLAACSRCQSELVVWREMPGAMADPGEPLPEGLWANIVSRLPEGLPAAEPSLTPRPESATRAPFRAPTSLRTWRTWRTWRARSIVVFFGAVAVAAVATAVVFGIDLVRSQDQVSRLQAQVSRLHTDKSRLQANANETPVDVALRTPGHSVVTLESSSGEQLIQFVIVPGGHGYLISSELPVLSAGQTYQLWRIAGRTPVSLGLLGAAPHDAGFTMADAPSGDARLAVTAEPAGGAAAPTGSIVASGTV
jgi:anti-sigma-K factor RskA